MDPVAAKYLGAGLACIGMGGAAIGVASGAFVGLILRVRHHGHHHRRMVHHRRSTAS